MILEFNTVYGETESITVVERSKFICNIKRINNEDEAKEYVNAIRKKHSLANHHCYAYIADENGLNMKFSDDGEPQGTAGMPMLDVLKSKKIYKTCAVVTRYFGGIKLGVGGLGRAYKISADEVLKNCEEFEIRNVLKFNCSYSQFEKLKATKGSEFSVDEVVYGENVLATISAKKTLKLDENLFDFEIVGERYEK